MEDCGKNEPLAQVIADERGEATVLRHKGFAREADMIDRLLDRVAAASEEFLRWLSEDEAELQSGLAVRTLRRRFRDWHESGLARYGAKGEREYLQAVVPHRANVDAMRARGRQAGGMAA
jgi:hypothetical protein